MGVALYSNGVGIDPNTCWQDLLTDGTLDGTGWTGTIKYVTDGKGIASALGVSTSTVQCANFSFNGHILTTTDVGTITVTPAMTFTGLATFNGGVSGITGYVSSTLASGDIIVGNGSNVATAVALSGDASISNTGALTLDTVNSNVGSYTSANVTVNAKGLVTAVANGTSVPKNTAATDTFAYSFAGGL